MWRSLGAHICALIAASAVVCPSPSPPPDAQTNSLEDLVAAVVRVKTFIDPEGRTTQNLGREREGSGVVIDSSGLVLTIGYLMVEAHSAELVTQDGRTVAGQRGGLRPRDGLRTAACDGGAQRAPHADGQIRRPRKPTTRC